MALRRHVGPVAAEVPKQARPRSGQQEEVEQAVVVVVDELRGARRRGCRRCRRRREAAAAVAQREHAGAVRLREEEIGVAVLVDVAERRHRRGPRSSAQPDVGGDIAERAVAEVAEEQGGAVGG